MRMKQVTVARRRAKIDRCGTTIIELMGMMGLLIVISTATYRSLGNITRANQDRQSGRSSRLEVERFSQTIRQDKKTSDDVSTNDRGFELSSENRLVRYRWSDDTPIVFREIFVGETRQAVDRFTFRAGTRVKTTLGETTDDRKLLSVEVKANEQEAFKSSAGSQGFLIEVAI